MTKIVDIKIHQPAGLLRLIADTKLEGCCPGVDESAATQIQALYRGLLLGESPTNRERLWQTMVGRAAEHGVTNALWAYVDVALWDLLGKTLGLPIFRLIGGFRDRVPAARTGEPHDQLEAVVAEALESREEGFLAYKDRYRGDAQATLEMPGRVRDAVGTALYLMHDGGQRYTPTEALRVGRALEEHDFHWFEAPLHEGDLLGLKKLAATLDVPVLSGPSHAALRVSSQMVAVQAVDMLRAGVPRSGGITDVIKIARLAESFGLHCELDLDERMGGFVHVQLMGAIKNAYFFATRQPGPRGDTAMIRNPLQVIDGYVEVPKEPGLGLELDWAEVEQHTAQIV